MNQDFLDPSGNKDVFKVPENYFEDFQTKINARIDMEEADKKVRGRKVIFQRVRPVLYIAAMFVLLFFCAQYILNTSPQPSSNYSQLEEEVNVESMTAEDILMSSLDEYSLMYYYLYENEE